MFVYVNDCSVFKAAVSLHIHQDSNTFQRLWPPSLLLIAAFALFCAQAYKVMAEVDKCFWLRLTRIKLFQLIQSADVSQDPILVDTASFPVNNKSLCFHQKPLSLCLSLFFYHQSCWSSSPPVPWHVSANTFTHIEVDLVSSKLGTHLCFLGLQPASCSPFKGIFLLFVYITICYFLVWIFQTLLSLEFGITLDANMLQNKLHKQLNIQWVILKED